MKDTESKLHPLFDAIEDKNYQDGNFEFKYQKIAGIVESLYRLPVMKIMFLDEIVTCMAEFVGMESAGYFEMNMTQVFNRVPGLADFGKEEV